VAPKIAACLDRGGHLLLAHGNLIADDRTRTGFDWGHAFGAATIAEVFDALADLALVRELRTPLFSVHLFRRTRTRSEKRQKPKALDIPLPFDLDLTPAVEKCILWDGATVTRAEARARERTREVPILMYHSVADDGPAELAPYRVSPAAFREQLRYLRRQGFHSITVAEWGASLGAGRPLPGRPVILTFDDGYKDFIENAWPALERADFSGTVFVVTEKVGGLADWDELADSAPPLMSWGDLAALRDKGVEIGSHSATHQDMQTLSSAGVLREGELARSTLRDKLGLDATAIAFPWGRSDASVREALAGCGYRLAVTTWGGRSRLGDDPMNLPRIEIFGDDDIDTFAAKLGPPGAATAADADEGCGEFAEPIGFDLEVAQAQPPPDPRPSRTARNGRERPQTATHAIASLDGGDTAIHPDYAGQLAARLDALIGEFVKLQSRLLAAVGSPPTLQKKLTMLFAQPITGRSSRIVTPGAEISPGIAVSFDEGGRVAVSVEPKTDHSLSPDSYLNTVELDFSGESPWLVLEVALDWKDVASAERFQASLYGRPNRTVSCQLALRLPRHSGAPLEIGLAKFMLRSDERNAVASGEVPMPDFVELDTGATPHLLVFFDTEAALSLIIHYMNVYFA
jgi:peptidoglycan/xylan/chitin deacetylase (PgdA/CDA1 family)